MNEEQAKEEKHVAWNDYTRKLIKDFEPTFGRVEILSRVHFFVSQGCPQDGRLWSLIENSKRAPGIKGLEALLKLMVFYNWDVVKFVTRIHAIFARYESENPGEPLPAVLDLPERVQALINRKNPENE